MPVFYILIIILILFVIISLVLNLLFNPYTWLIIAVLAVISMIRRHLYRKQVEEFNQEFQRRTQKKKEYYYQETASQKQASNDDVIDVDYKIVDEDREK